MGDRDGETLEVLEAEAQRLRHRLAVLAEAGMTLSSSLDPEQVLRRLGELVVPAVADGCEVALLDERGSVRRFVFASGLDEDRLRRRELTRLTIDDRHPIAEVLRTGRPILLDVRQDVEGYAFGPATVDTSARSFGVERAAVVPLKVRGTVIGALALAAGAGRAAADDFVELATEVADRAALAYENARLYMEQRTIAQTLQRSLLPITLPVIDQLDLAARYWTAGPGTDVGGDFYDVFRVADDPESPIVAFIGDVCGKGVEAAAVTALARHTLRAAVTHVADPTDALRWLHEAVRARSEDSFVTVALLQLRLGDGVIDVEAAVGGHPRPIVVRPDGDTVELSDAGSAPGLPLWRPAPLVRTSLRPGDAVVLYTDGVTDVPGDAALTSDDMRALVSGLAGRPADEIATQIGVQVERLRPRREREDDIALLVLRAVEG